MVKFFSGVAILAIALIAQVWLASTGIYINLAFAALITFAFIFNFWELSFLILIAVFFLNWQPAPSPELIMYAVMPLAAFAFHWLITWQRWMGDLAMLCLGYAVLYAASAPALFTANIGQLLLDLAVGLLFGELMLFALV